MGDFRVLENIDLDQEYRDWLDGTNLERVSAFSRCINAILIQQVLSNLELHV
jgi:hypothetical protein